MRTLISGFGPFGDVVNNPSERLAIHFGRVGAPGHEIVAVTLPTSYARGPQVFLDALAVADKTGEPFNVALMLGVAAAFPSWRVEQFGRNHDESRVDVDGFRSPVRKIVHDGPDILDVTAPVQSMVDAIASAGLPVVASNSAGGFLCNHLLYRALNRARETGASTRMAFLHIPCDEITFGGAAPPELRPFPFEDHVRALNAVLAALASAQVAVEKQVTRRR